MARRRRQRSVLTAPLTILVPAVPAVLAVLVAVADPEERVVPALVVEQVARALVVLRAPVAPVVWLTAEQAAPVPEAVVLLAARAAQAVPALAVEQAARAVPEAAVEQAAPVPEAVVLLAARAAQAVPALAVEQAVRVREHAQG